ncbi:hypothetical protein [Hymenobacter rubripertinctus]|uniref:Uncharacterized protein n=1 Tax=Hymenobacter rubripertinctus TaxID=2029981 RepID=A0A418R314_9BACT|nr:hypothetical protein [Hymenobacter rubripertinctus]RIY11805.1 hypothetical protein D0T11_06510 [Hymenobacter rubripertinctus]
MLRKQLLRSFLVAAALGGATSAAQAQGQEQKTYANNSLSSLGIGSAYSTSLWSSSYIGFNLNKQNYWNSDWKSFSDGSNNGASAMVGGINGSLMFLTLPTANGSAGGQTITDVNMPSLIRMTLHADGRLQIGNKRSVGMHSDAKLSVYGKVTASSLYILADNPSNWADYVFEKDYQLTPLPELEAYVQKNKHLPEVPTTADVTANGANLGEMNVLLLKKVEELTLHLIDLNKQVQQLKADQVAGK